MELLTPITSPNALISGPPELPGLIDASVWIMSTYEPSPGPAPTRLRPVALSTPVVTLGSVLPSRNPYGLPIAITHSPISRSSERPSGATGRSEASTRRTARSLTSSTPTTFAS